MTGEPTRNRRIVVAGNLSLDDTVNPRGRVPMAPGGDALYASLGLAAWGLTPTLLTLVGDDYPPAFLGRIAESGVDSSWVRRVPGPTVHYQVTNFSDGRREYHWMSSEDRLAATSPESRDYAGLADAAWLHLAAMPIECQETGVEAARRVGVPYSLDPHEEYVVGFEDRIRQMVHGAAFMPSELEVRRLFPDLEALEPLTLARIAAERFDAWQPSLVAIKIGDLGSVVRRRGHSVHVAAPRVEVVDSTGAGDGFAGGFIAGWLATGDPRVGAACGTVAAVEILGRFGAFAMKEGTTVEDRIQRAVTILDGLPIESRRTLDVGRVAASLRFDRPASTSGHAAASSSRTSRNA